MVRTHAKTPRRRSPIILTTKLTSDPRNQSPLDLPLARVTCLKRLIGMLRAITCLAGVLMVGLGLTGCIAPVGTNKSTPSKVYSQTHENALIRAPSI
jgi:hypothetical protein